MNLLIPILCVIIASSLFVSIVSYQNTASIIIDSAKSEGLRIVQSMRYYIDLAFSTIKLDMTTILMQPSIRSVLLEDSEPDELVQYLLSLRNRFYIYDSITIVNRYGIAVASTSGSTGTDRSDRVYFKESIAGRDYISDVETSRSTGNMVTYFSIPVYDTNNINVIGVILASVGLKEINNRYVIPVSLLDDYGYAMIINKTGTIIGHKDETMLGEKIDIDLHQKILTRTEEQTALEGIINGIPSMLFIDKKIPVEWFPIIICPVSDFHIAANKLAVTNIALTIAVILILSFAVYFMIDGITHSLSSVIKYADEVSRGNLDINLLIERNDEVGTLAQSLRNMVASLKHMINVSEQKTQEAEEYSKKITDSIAYAGKIQKNMLPRDSVLKTAFSDYSVIWKPRDIVGGDFYWVKNFNDGAVLCVCDCTGHGTPGSLLSMLTVSAFESIITEKNHSDTAEILYSLDQKLASVLNVKEDNPGSRVITDINDGCDLAVIFVAKNGNVIISAGNIDVFVCDGEDITRIRGQMIQIGEKKIRNKYDVISHNNAAKYGNKFYIASDGLFGQIGEANRRSFGYKIFKQIILENHNLSQNKISDKIWNAFEKHRGEEPFRDDLQLITFSI